MQSRRRNRRSLKLDGDHRAVADRGVRVCVDGTVNAPNPRRAHLIAAFALLHVVACCGAALPNTSGSMGRAAWRDPRVVDELSSWAKVLGTRGSDLERRLYDLAQDWTKVRKALLTPVQPYLTLSGLTQGWVVFVAGTRQADRFEVIARDARGVGRRLYLRADNTAQGQSRLLEGQAWRNVTFSAAWPDTRSRN